MIIRSLIVSILFSAGVLSAETIHLDESHQAVAGGLHGSVIVDSAKQYSVEFLITPAGKQLFKRTHEAVPNYPVMNRHYWFEYDVVRDSSQLQWTISVNNPSVRKADVYIVENDSIVQHFVLGSVVPYEQRTIKNRNYFVPLPLRPGIHTRILLRIDGGDLGHFFPVYFESVPITSQRISNDSMVYGIYTGLMLFMTLLSVFFYVTMRDKTYMYYALSVITTWLLNLTIDGVSFQFLFTDSPAPFTWSYLIAIIFYEVFIIQFGRTYLRIAELTPRFNKAFTVATVLALLSPLSAYADISVAVNATVGLTFVLYIMLLTSGVIAIRKQHRPAWFYVVAMGANITLSVFITLYYHGMLPHVFVYSGLVGTVLQVMIISIGLADQQSVARREKDEVQRKALLEQTELTTAFARFVPKEMLAFLGRDHIKDVALGDVVQRELTIMFSDIRAFTTISEEMSSHDTFLYLNDYLRYISPIIRRNGGFIDKYLGDGILAIFPNSAQSAVDCGIEMLQSLRTFNSTFLKFDSPVSIGIGLHTGEVMLGTIGEDQRFDTTVIADVVNLASRIESLTKYYGNSFVVSDEIIARISADPKYHWRYVDRVKVKGSTRGMDLFEIIDGDDPDAAAKKIATEPAMSHAIRTYQMGQFTESMDAVRQVLKVIPNDSLAQLYLQRNEYNIHYNIPAEQVSVTSFENK